jgi:RNA polymerase sigma factor (sigma-70 family)
MTAAPLAMVVRRLRTAAGGEAARDLADAELLRRFAAGRDEAAFAAIVHRYGRLVLGVCRRVLGHEQDAEDACQATFLVLARRAPSIRKHTSLASWLHGVAHHVSSNARRAAARRRKHERRVKQPRPAPDADLTWRELQSVLEEEINRMPPTYRAAFVLCCLDGRSKSEAARQLGWKEGTVSGRLARARKQLQQRLARRGVALSAVLGALAVASGPARAVLPAGLTQSTVQAALRYAAGHAAGAAGPHVAALADAAVTALLAARCKVVVALVVGTALLVAGAGALVHRALSAQPTAKEGQPASTTVSAVPSKPRQAESGPGQDAGETEHAVRGTVRDAAGKPVAGASVYWVGPLRMAMPGYLMPRGQERYRDSQLLGRTKSDGEGKFALHAAFDPNRYYLTELVGRAPRTGFGGTLYHAERRITLTLHPEVKIEGRLLTLTGTPVKGAGVRLTDLLSFKQWLPLEGWSLGPTLQEGDRTLRVPDWPDATVSDGQGRFTLGGLARGSQATVEITHPDFARESVTVTAGTGLLDLVPGSGPKAVRPKFTRVLEPGRVLHGVVTDKETGGPVTDVLVRVGAGQTTGTALTDARGRFRVEGLSASQDRNYSVELFPASASGYIALGEPRRPWPAGQKILEKDFALARGQVVRGRVTDAETHRPLAGVSVVYEPARGNPHNRGGFTFHSPVLSDSQGRFALTGLTGEGFLVAHAPSRDYVRVALPPKAVRDLEETFVHGYARVEVAEGNAAPVQIALRRGVTITAQAVGPDGKPAAWVNYMCREAGVWTHEVMNEPMVLNKGLIRLDGCDPRRSHRVYVLQPTTHLGAVADLRYDPRATGPRPVRLERTGSVHGRVVDLDGSAVRGAQVLPWLLLAAPTGKLTADEFYRLQVSGGVAFYWPLDGPFGAMAQLNVRTTDRGEFRLDNLLPSVRLYIGGAAGGRRTDYRIVALKPGEDRDLGQLALEKKR